MFKTFARLPEPVCSLNNSFCIQEVNDNWIKTLGKRNYTNISLFELIPERYMADQLEKSILSAKDHSVLLNFEVTDLSGNQIPFTWSIVFDKENQLYILCGQNQSRNQELETRYERMYHSTSDAVMLLDENRFTDCNKATLEVFKVDSVEEFIKFHPADLSPPFQPDGMNSLDKANAMIMKAFHEGRSFFEWTHRNLRGEDFPCEVLLSRIELHGRFHIQASVRDISERVKIQKELDESKVQQINASRLAALGEMAGGVAHEINNPMAVIRSQAEHLINSLNRKLVSTETLERGLHRIIETSDRISKIIKGLKLLSRDSSGDPLISCELNTIIVETLSFCEEKLKSNQIHFEYKNQEQALSILARGVEISQVLLNLITNSIDAIEGTPSPWIKLEVKKVKKMAEITITDSGTGIPPQIAEKITLPFYTTKEVGKGTGLGLSITKRIIERHNGEFFLNTKSKNTQFVIKFPLEDGPL